jgi:hypothetical protein
MKQRESQRLHGAAAVLRDLLHVEWVEMVIAILVVSIAALGLDAVL